MSAPISPLGSIAFALQISGVSLAALSSSSNTLQTENTWAGDRHAQQVLLQNSLEGLGAKQSDMSRSDQMAQQVLLQNTLEGLGAKQSDMGRSEAQQITVFEYVLDELQRPRKGQFLDARRPSQIE